MIAGVEGCGKTTLHHDVILLDSSSDKSCWRTDLIVEVSGNWQKLQLP